MSDPSRSPNHLCYDSSALNTFNLAKINPGSFFVPVYDDNSPYHSSSSVERQEDYGAEVIPAKPGLARVHTGLKTGLPADVDARVQTGKRKAGADPEGNLGAFDRRDTCPHVR